RSGGRMKPRDRKNPKSFKTRRGKVGGYRDYFDDREIAEIDRRIAEQLSPVFGYAQNEKPSHSALPGAAVAAYGLGDQINEAPIKET
ncbi:MAG: hypothetical protein AAF637_14000, partial [Pseudomonadota bacterium]